jgi:hypothetical protein
MTNEILKRAVELRDAIKDAEEWLNVLDTLGSSQDSFIQTLNLIAIDTTKGHVLFPLIRDYPGASVAVPILKAAVRVRLVGLRAELEAL